MISKTLVDETISEDHDKDSRFYDVEEFRRVVEKQESIPPPKGLRRAVVYLRNGIDSVSGVISTFLAISIFFVAPLVVIMGALYGLPGFLISCAGMIGGLSLYVRRKMGSSMRFVDSSLGLKLLGQLVGYALMLVVFYLIFVVLLGNKL